MIDLSLVEMSSFCPVPQEAEKLSATPVCRARQSLRARQSHLLVVLLLELFVPKGGLKGVTVQAVSFFIQFQISQQKALRPRLWA